MLPKQLLFAHDFPGILDKNKERPRDPLVEEEPVSFHETVTGL